MAYEYEFIELRKILEKSHLGLYRPGYYFGLNGLEIEVRKDDVKLYGVTDLKEKIGIQIKVDNDIYYKTEELKEVYRKSKAWDNYVDSVRSLVSKHADEDTDIEKEVRDILSVYMEDE